MALKEAVVGAIALLFLLTVAAGCRFLSGEGGPPGTTATPRAAGASGAAEETPSPATTAVRSMPTATTSGPLRTRR